MANFIEVSYYGRGNNGVVIYESRLKNPIIGYINLELVEHISKTYEGNLTITNDDDETKYHHNCKYFFIDLSSGYRYFLPATEFNKFIKKPESL